MVAGHICLDITPEFPEKKSKKLGDILTPGKLLNVGNADIHTGGAGLLVIKGEATSLDFASINPDGVAGRDVTEILDIEKDGFEHSYVPEKILSGTGAGDTSIAAFLTAMLEGYSMEEAMQLAAATGASCVAAYDELSGLKSFEELNVKIANGWKKVKG